MRGRFAVCRRPSRVGTGARPAACSTRRSRSSPDWTCRCRAVTSSQPSSVDAPRVVRASSQRPRAPVRSSLVFGRDQRCPDQPSDPPGQADVPFGLQLRYDPSSGCGRVQQGEPMRLPATVATLDLDKGSPDVLVPRVDWARLPLLAVATARGGPASYAGRQRGKRGGVRTVGVECEVSVSDGCEGLAECLDQHGNAVA